MELMKRKFVGQALQPEEAAQILRNIRLDRAEDYRDFALLMTGLATGARKADLLQMRCGQLYQLPEAAQSAVKAFWRRITYGYSGESRPNDLMFPNLGWWLGDRNIQMTSRQFVVMLKERAMASGIDPDRIGTATWRQTAARIVVRMGNFDAFCASLRGGMGAPPHRETEPLSG